MSSTPAKTPQVLTFRNNYHKLADYNFTTIRGKARFAKFAIGDLVTVETPKGSFAARVTGKALRRVSAIPLAFLKLDAEFPGCTITSRQQFVNLLNSFRAPHWAQVTLDSELTVIYLAKL